MKKSEEIKLRKQHNAEVFNIFVSKLNEGGNIVKDIEKLSIQDLIMLNNNIEWYFNNDLFSSETSIKAVDIAENQIPKIIANRIRKSDAIWTIYDLSTTLPFIDDDNRIWIFTKCAAADECANYFIKNNLRKLDVREVTKSWLITFFVSSHYQLGIDQVLISNDEHKLVIPMRYFTWEHVLYNGYSEIANPRYCRALSKYIQETSYNEPTEEKEGRLREYESEMISAFYHATFLYSRSFVGKKDKKKEEQKRIPSIQIFTDIDQYKKVVDIQKHWEAEIPATKLLELNADEYRINPDTHNFSMTRDMVREMIEGYEIGYDGILQNLARSDSHPLNNQSSGA